MTFILKEGLPCVYCSFSGVADNRGVYKVAQSGELGAFVNTMVLVARLLGNIPHCPPFGVNLSFEHSFSILPCGLVNFVPPTSSPPPH